MNGGHAKRRRAARLLLACGVGLSLLLAVRAADAKPRAPVLLRARITGTDPVAGTADIEIQARARIKARTVAVRCQLPQGATVVPGTGQWTQTARGRVHTMRVILPPQRGTLVVKAELRGDGVRTGAIVGLALPRRAGAPAAPKKTPRIIRTSKGEKLRLHK